MDCVHTQSRSKMLREGIVILKSCPPQEDA